MHDHSLLWWTYRAHAGTCGDSAVNMLVPTSAQHCVASCTPRCTPQSSHTTTHHGWRPPTGCTTDRSCVSDHGRMRTCSSLGRVLEMRQAAVSVRTATWRAESKQCASFHVFFTSERQALPFRAAWLQILAAFGTCMPNPALVLKAHSHHACVYTMLQCSMIWVDPLPLQESGIHPADLGASGLAAIIARRALRAQRCLARMQATEQEEDAQIGRVEARLIQLKGVQASMDADSECGDDDDDDEAEEDREDVRSVRAGVTSTEKTLTGLQKARGRGENGAGTGGPVCRLRLSLGGVGCERGWCLLVLFARALWGSRLVSWTGEALRHASHALSGF